MTPTVTRAMRAATGRSLRRTPRGWRCVWGRNFIATCGFNLELMRCHLPGVRRHSTVDLVGVIDFGRPHLTGGVGETANVKEAEANFFDDESVLSPKQHPHRFLHTVGSENDQFAVGLGGAGDLSVDGVGLPIEGDGRDVR